jgi:hypothetical protein
MVLDKKVVSRSDLYVITIVGEQLRALIHGWCEQWDTAAMEADWEAEIARPEIQAALRVEMQHRRECVLCRHPSAAVLMALGRRACLVAAAA